MRLLEYQAKRLLAECGIAVPAGVLVTDAGDQLPTKFPVVVKAQVPIGGRGKAGAIRIAADEMDARRTIASMISSEVKGYVIGSVLVEPQADIRRELYLALLIDRNLNRPIFLASQTGGIDIEEVARRSPDNVLRQPVDLWRGIPDYVVRSLGRALGVKSDGQLRALLEGMLLALRSNDATLVEINPLADTAGGLLALDAKITLDDKAAGRHAEQFARLLAEQAEHRPATFASRAEQLAAEKDITYVMLDGDVGVVADGAGTGMLTLDLIRDAGGRAANFCDLGGRASPERMEQAIETVLANPRVKALLITLIGGLTRMDEMAQGIVSFVGRQSTSVPLIVRMCGTQEVEGRALLRQVGIEAFDDLAPAVANVVAVAGSR